jgi:hypothetical protein
MNYVSLIGFLKSVEGTEEWIIAVNVFLATEPVGEGGRDLFRLKVGLRSIALAVQINQQRLIAPDCQAGS